MIQMGVEFVKIGVNSLFVFIVSNVFVSLYSLRASTKLEKNKFQLVWNFPNALWILFVSFL